MKRITLTKTDGGARTVMVPPSLKPLDIIEHEGMFFVRAYGVMTEAYRQATFYSVPENGVPAATASIAKSQFNG